MKLLIIGSKGMLGSKFVSMLKDEHEVYEADLPEIDITDSISCERFVEKVSPQYIIHCAAYTAVDNAEDDRGLCEKVNVLGSKNVAAAAEKAGATLVYYSTDYIFDGSKGEPYLEDDPVNPVNFYGKTKLDGERAVRENCAKHYIMRITWLFGENGKNFPAAMLKLAETKSELNVVDDQLGSPTYTEDVVKQTMKLIESGGFGTYHSSAEGICSWFDVAKYTFETAGVDMKLNAIPSSEYPTKAARPAYSYLENANLKKLGINLMPDWKDGIERYINNIR